MTRAGLALLVCLASAAGAQNQGVTLKEEGSTLGRVESLDCVGTAVTCSRIGIKGTVTATTPVATQTAYAADASITAQQLAADPSGCGANQYATDIAANGALTCYAFDTLIYSDAPNAGADAGVLTTGAVLVSKSITVAAQDSVTVEVDITAANSSGTDRAFSFLCRVGSTTLMSITPTSQSNAASTSRSYYRVRCRYSVASSSSAKGDMDLVRYASAASGSAQSGQWSGTWWDSIGDYTGSQTFAIHMASDATTQGQVVWVEQWKITRQSSNP